MRYFKGIDVGKHGAASIIDEKGRIISILHFSKSSEHEIAAWFAEMKAKYGDNLRAALEKVRSSPQMGRASVFTFGWGYGLLRGLLAANGIPYEEPTPQVWQTALGCRTGGEKNISKQKAHELWPGSIKVITHDTADSLLIAEWLRRKSI